MPLQPTNLPTDITEGELGHIGDSETAHSVINELTSTSGADRVGTADGSTVEATLASKADSEATGDAIDALTGRVDDAESAIDARPTSADLAAPGGAGLIGSSLTGGNVAAVLASLSAKRIEGTGFPTVAAPVGTIYVDTNATNGAVLWIKAAGTGTSGWQVLWGDTGSSRVPSGEMLNGWANQSEVGSSALRLRRIGNLVSLVGYIKAPAAAGVPTAYQLPTGYRPPYNVRSPWATSADGSGDVGGFSVVPSSGPLVIGKYVSGGSVSISMIWATSEPWPTEMPGNG